MERRDKIKRRFYVSVREESYLALERYAESINRSPRAVLEERLVRLVEAA